MNIFRKEISKIKYAIIVSIHILLSYLMIYFLSMQQPEEGKQRGGEHQLWGEKERKEEKEEI